MLKIAFGAVFALFSASVVAAQETVTWNNNIQGWSVAIDRTINDSCFIISGFNNEQFVRFQFNASQQNVQLIVANIHWDAVENGKNYDIEVAFGDRDAWSGVAKGHRWSDILPSLVLSVPMENEQAAHFMEDMAAKEAVSISYEGAEIANLALAGAQEAVASMLDCQAAMSDAHMLKGSKPDPFASEDQSGQTQEGGDMTL
ncbi:MAG: hypothetical protein HKN27_17880 [Silicimonas sp.]|nr:hypothetical protein [Silicimonas sp.]